MSPDQIQFSKQIKFSPAGIAMTIFGIVLGVLLVLPILILLLVAGSVALVVFCILLIYARIVCFFQGTIKKDSEGRKNVKIRTRPSDQP